jgi:excisionase family DNA binding protein
MSRKNVPQYLTEQELSLRLGVSLSVVQNMRRPGVKDPLPFHKIGKCIRYSEADVHDWLERRRCFDSHEAARIQKGA